MSHFTRVRTQLRDIETVRRALADLGYDVTDGAVRGHGGQQTEADLVIKMDNGYDIGFRLEEGTVSLVADFWGLRIRREAFLQKVAQKYAYLTVLDQAGQQGWQTVTEEVQQDGSIRLVMQRWQ